MKAAAGAPEKALREKVNAEIGKMRRDRANGLVNAASLPEDIEIKALEWVLVLIDADSKAQAERIAALQLRIHRRLDKINVKTVKSEVYFLTMKPKSEAAAGRGPA